MPPWLADAIGAAYDRLAEDGADVPVAVRSSATAEDTASASFAGMNETFLNVRGKDAVIDAVKRCWQSLFGARTIYYRGQRGFSQSDMDIAVVVQRQIASTRAGVMFTIDPATGERDHLVIEGSFGLGEVGGLRAGFARPLRGREVDHVDPGPLGPAQGADDRGGGRRRHRHPRPRREGEPPPGAERRGGAAAGGARA